MKTLKSVFEEHGVTVAEVARRSGVTASSIYTVTQGVGTVGRMSIDNFIRIAHALDMTADELHAVLNEVDDED